MIDFESFIVNCLEFDFDSSWFMTLVFDPN
jgi:hypothetical protein